MQYVKHLLVLSAVLTLFCAVAATAQTPAAPPNQTQVAATPPLPKLPTAAVPTPQTSGAQAAAAQLTDEQRTAMAPFLPEPADQNRVADLRDILHDRVYLVEAGNHESDIENADGLMLLTMSTLPAGKREATLKALDSIWDMREDYYDQLLDVMKSIYRYRVWLGPERYDRLSSQREFLLQYQQDFADWRDQQPPRPWRYGEVLVKAPAYSLPETRAAIPVQPAYTPPPTGYMAQQFPYTSSFPRSNLRGQPGNITTPGRLPQNPGAGRIIVPNLRSGQGPAQIPSVPVFRQSSGQ